MGSHLYHEDAARLPVFGRLGDLGTYDKDQWKMFSRNKVIVGLRKEA